MATYWFNQSNTAVHIPETQEINSVTQYRIVVNVGNIQWSLLHRYKEFLELHNQLVVDHGVQKDLLPPKKVINNKCPEFIETRRKGLEVYLQYLVNYFKRTMPKLFVDFLQFNVYEIFFKMQELALYFYKEGDKLLQESKNYQFNLLQLNAISECLHSSFPQIPQVDPSQDFGHVLDFCSQIKTLIIKETETFFMMSNIELRKLPISFTAFKHLKALKVLNTELNNVTSLGTLRSTLFVIEVHDSKIESVSDILECDIIHRNNIYNKQVFENLRKLDLSSNNINKIDEAINQAPNLEILFLANNKITTITNLEHLSQLHTVNLSNNLISDCTDLHLKLGNVSSIDLSQNLISSLQGFSKLYSIETICLATNKIAHIDDVVAISELPCIENLILTGNPVSTEVDYRVKVFQIFQEHQRNICLDNERASQAELDKVSVLHALKIVKEGKRPILRAP